MLNRVCLVPSLVAALLEGRLEPPRVPVIGDVLLHIGLKENLIFVRLEQS
jgi:hypothetical protein